MTTCHPQMIIPISSSFFAWTLPGAGLSLTTDGMYYEFYAGQVVPSIHCNTSRNPRQTSRGPIMLPRPAARNLEGSEWKRSKLLTPVEARGFHQVAARESPLPKHISVMSDSPIETQSLFAFVTASGLWTAARWQRSQVARLKSFSPLTKLSGTNPVRRCSI